MTVRIDNPAFRSISAEVTAAYRGLREAQAPEAPPIVSTQFGERTANPMRPRCFQDVVGQQGAKKLLAAAIRAAKQLGHTLDHTLLTGPAGTGKSTIAHVVGEEMGVNVIQLSAPVAYDVLLQLREQMNDGDILFVDEIHLMAIAERRGKESITQPEQFYSILEDRVIITPQGPLPYPEITVIGATTDPGRLPESFLDRFPLRPRLVEYTDDDLAVIAKMNAKALGMHSTRGGAMATALAAAGTPRIVNNLVRNARLFDNVLNERAVAQVREANGIAGDGLDALQQQMLKFLWTRGATTTKQGVVYQCSLGSLATALGLSRDTKAVNLYVEPLLIKRGYVQVSQQGRRLTDAGIIRASAIR